MYICNCSHQSRFPEQSLRKATSRIKYTRITTSYVSSFENRDLTPPDPDSFSSPLPSSLSLSLPSPRSPCLSESFQSAMLLFLYVQLSRIRTSNFSAFSFNFCSLLDCTSLDFACSSSECCCILPYLCRYCEKKKREEKKPQFSISALAYTPCCVVPGLVGIASVTRAPVRDHMTQLL